MNTPRKIAVLRDTIAGEMEALGYSKWTIENFRQSCNHFERYAESKGTSEYSEELATEYFLEEFGFGGNAAGIDERSRHRAVLYAVNRLGDYARYGHFRDRSGLMKKEPEWGEADRTLIDAYLNDTVSADASERTRRSRETRLKHFYEFLRSRRVDSVCDVTEQIVSAYVLSLQTYARGTAANLLAGLRLYGRHLHKTGVIELDVDILLPKISAKGNLNVPALWSKDEITGLLDKIDRGNPVGKRDYAVLLLISQLGLRSSDIVAMKLSHLNWNSRTIELPQHKTGKLVTLPMFDDVGWAIIDYIRSGRPQIENPHLFLTSNAPYKEFTQGGSIGTILRKRMKASGLRCEATSKHETKGTHSLRHALARRLAEQKTPLPTIVNIMGHTSHEGTSPYLRVDIEGLRECALALGGGDCVA